MKIFNIDEITYKAKQAFYRFPITLSWAILGTFFILYIIEFDLKFEKYLREVSTIFLGISWLIGTRFLVEQQNESKKKWWYFIITLLLLVVFYFHLPSEDSFENPLYYVRFLLYLFAGHLFLFVAPFFSSWNKNAFWNYLKSVFIAIGRSLLFSIVLYLGLSLALLSVEYLFNADINGERYFQIYVFCLGIINTWTYLSDFPKEIQTNTTINYNKALEVFVKYILIPLVILYIIILYAYSFKILFTWDLPKGWVSYLVISLSLLGFIIQAMINPIRKTIKSSVINKFLPWFYYLLLPLLMLLFIAIFKRIGDYGITENRYFVFIIAVWITVMTLYLLFSKNKFLKILPITLGGLALLSSIGFWSAFNVSKNSQASEFKKTFNVVKLKENVATKEEYQSLESILRYFYNRESLNSLNPIIGIHLDSVKKQSNNRVNRFGYFNTNFILDSLGIDKPRGSIEPNTYYYKNFNLDKNNLNIKISNYKSLNYTIFKENDDHLNKVENYKFRLIEDKTKAVIVENNKIIFELSLKSLFDKKTSNNYNQTLPHNEMTINLENESTTMKIIIESINLKKDKNNKTVIQVLKAYVLIK